MPNHSDAPAKSQGFVGEPIEKDTCSQNRQFPITTAHPILYYLHKYSNGLFTIEGMTISPIIDYSTL